MMPSERGGNAQRLRRPWVIGSGVNDLAPQKCHQVILEGRGECLPLSVVMVCGAP